MPSYDYKCNDCELVFTITKSMLNDSTPKCPECDSNENIQRVWGCVNFGGMSNKTSSSNCGTCASKSCSTCG